jgi:predicted phosphodiesterase
MNRLIEARMTDNERTYAKDPTRVAIISDIHGNLSAFEVVLKTIQEMNVDTIHCLGDIVGYGPFPNECIELVRQHCQVVVKGNHDSGVVSETNIDDFNKYGQAAIRWTIQQMTAENLDYLKKLPLISIDGDLTLVHASPFRPELWTYVLSFEEARESFHAFRTGHCFIGHTHIPVVVGEDLTINAYKPLVRQLINVGSVGQPRDGNPDAAFGLLDISERSYTLVRVPYDYSVTAKAIRKAGLPSFLGKRLQRGV